jgi:hypothetical protein
MSSNETNEGAAYLSTLKNSGSPPVAGKAAVGAATVRPPAKAHPARTPVREIAPDSRPTATRVEKRKSARYRCKGSAHLQENGTVATWATFADISMHGCYVEAATPPRLGTVLNLSLEVNGFQVKATGEVRVVYPNLGMGIRFIKVSEADREQLRELIASISRSSAILDSRATHAPSIPQSASLPGVANPSAALQALHDFFEDRHVMGREQFLTILRNSH